MYVFLSLVQRVQTVCSLASQQVNRGSLGPLTPFLEPKTGEPTEINVPASDVTFNLEPGPVPGATYDNFSSDS